MLNNLSRNRDRVCFALRRELCSSLITVFGRLEGKRKVIATLRYNFPPFCTLHNWFSIISICYRSSLPFSLFLRLCINREYGWVIEEITKRDTISWKFWVWRLARLPVLLDFHFPRDIYITDNGKKIAYRLVLSTSTRSGTHDRTTSDSRNLRLTIEEDRNFSRNRGSRGKTENHCLSIRRNILDGKWNWTWWVSCQVNFIRFDLRSSSV